MGHYYDSQSGDPRFTIVGKNGKIRQTTIADARKEGWLASVTTILKLLHNPMLEQWKLAQVALAAQTLPRKDGESDENFSSRIITDAFRQTEDAADLGTRVHEAIENHFQGKAWDQSLEVYVNAVDKWTKDNGVTFLAHEQRLINREHRYAGTTDGIIMHKGEKGIADIKTRRTNKKYPVKPYSTEPLQIAAYSACVPGVTKGVNIYVSTTEPGRIEATWYDKEEIERNLETFLAINRVFQLINRF